MRARAGLQLGRFIISLRHRDANRVAENNVRVYRRASRSRDSWRSSQPPFLHFLSLGWRRRGKVEKERASGS